jgi:hypothetical protein
MYRPVGVSEGITIEKVGSFLCSSKLLLEQYVQAGCCWNGTFKQVVAGAVLLNRTESL